MSRNKTTASMDRRDFDAVDEYYKRVLDVSFNREAAREYARRDLAASVDGVSCVPCDVPDEVVTIGYSTMPEDADDWDGAVGCEYATFEEALEAAAHGRQLQFFDGEKWLPGDPHTHTTQRYWRFLRPQ